MTIMTKMLAGGLGLAAMAAAAPASAQYQYGYPYGGSYGSPYGNAYGYYGNQYGYNNGNAMMQAAASQCAAAVQSRLNNRGVNGIQGILGTVLGVNSAANARVLTISSVNPSSTRIRVRGLANSGQYAYSPYGYGMYGATGAGYAADLSFKCDVDYSGRVRDVDINRRR